MRLSSFARDEHSQFGEDGMLDHIFDKLGEGSRVCVEFGASDGTTCSNTRKLWEDGWSAVLVEGAPGRFEHLLTTIAHAPNCRGYEAYVFPTGDSSIDAILKNCGVRAVDFMSIDVDGIDYWIWQAMVVRPRVVCIEYNQSIPPHVAIASEEMGASAKALVELGASKRYDLVGLNKGNLFFVVAEEAAVFADYERDLPLLFPYEGLSYLATDYRGRYFAVGEPPWGVSSTPFDDAVEGSDADKVTRITFDIKNTLGVSYLHLIRAFEDEYNSQAIFIPQDWEAAPTASTELGVLSYRRLFGQEARLVIVDVANQVDLAACMWVTRIAESYGYELRVVGKELFVFTLRGLT